MPVQRSQTTNNYDMALRLREKGLSEEALDLFVADAKSSSPTAEQSKMQARSIVQGIYDEKQLMRLTEKPDYKMLHPDVFFRLGQISVAQQDIASAKSHFKTALELEPQSEISLLAQSQLNSIAAAETVAPETVGILLPLTGKNAALGRKALRAFEYGLGLSITGSRLKLAVMDTEGRPDLARRGVDRLVNEDNVITIVGDILARPSAAAASRASQLGVPLITLSQKANLTDAGPLVFRNSLTSEMQVHHLVRSAMDDLGIKRFAILHPNDAYGTEFANSFWDAVLARGGEVTAAQSYDPNTTDFKPVVDRLVGTYYLEARAEEFRVFRSQLSEKKLSKSARKSEPSLADNLPPIVRFDAIFIPDTPKALGQISGFLALSGVKDIHIL
ncbi:MAG: penicillin-binding protein activator, partial [Bdellovibrionaceae bacterium]|nr:penicillin-binding protein activator [Pseudobdellovibrionaceae bacterium]